jgi:glycosyltransferase involved in cell wall biosynthesis
MKLSIILPARNEEFLIEGVLRDISGYLKNRKNNSYEILVIINGTTDKTDEIVSGFSKTNKKVKILKSKPGYGKALKVGLKNALGEYIAIFNVDFYDLRMVDMITTDLYGKDFIIGSKMTYWSNDKRSLLRRLVSLFFNYYLKIVYKFAGSDTHGIKIFKKEVVKKILPKCKTNSGIFDTEFVLRSQYAGYKFADFPVTIVEKRSPRFSQRIFQTPKDMLSLYRSIKSNAKN